MPNLTLKHLKRSNATNEQSNVGYLDVSQEGICPKTGQQMRKVKMLSCSKPQTVWYCDESRIALPMSEPDLL